MKQIKITDENCEKYEEIQRKNQTPIIKHQFSTSKTIKDENISSNSDISSKELSFINKNHSFSQEYSQEKEIPTILNLFQITIVYDISTSSELWSGEDSEYFDDLFSSQSSQ